MTLLVVWLCSRRDPRSSVPAGPRDPRAGMNRPPGPAPMTPQQGPPPQVMPSGPPPSSAATSAAIGRALGAGTSDQEKVYCI